MSSSNYISKLYLKAKKKLYNANIRNISICMCLIFALVAYIFISYQSWQQQQLLQLATIHNIETFTPSTHHTIPHTNTSNNTSNGTSNGILLWSQMIQPTSAQASQLFAYQKQHYIRLMNNVNITARGYDTLDELQTMMSKCCLPITKSNLDSINNMLDLYYNSKSINDIPSKTIVQKYLHYWLPKIQLAKSLSNLESNMPHTHSNVLMMPEHWWQNPDFSTFMHELVHVHQRVHPTDWNILYTKYWNFKHINGLDSGKVRGLDSIIARSRMNPDGTDFNWLWMGAKDGRPRWIGAVYPIGRSAKLVHVLYVSVPLDPIGVDNSSSSTGWLLPTIYHNGQNLPLIANDIEFMTFFGVKPNNYHPNELGAQMMEEFIKSNRSNSTASPAFTIFGSWLQNVASKYS